MKKTYALILIDLCLFIVGGNMLSFSAFGTTIRISEVFSLLLGLFLIGYFFREKLEKSMQYFLIWTIFSVVLIVLNTISFRFSLNQLAVAFLYLFRFAYSVFLAYLVSKFIRKNDKTQPMLKFVNGMYLAVCFIGFFQLVFFPVAFDWYGIFKKIGVDWHGDPHINRLVSTDFDPNYLSSCLLIGFAVNLFLLIREFKKDSRIFSFKKILRYAFGFIYLITVLLTKSRSGILGLAITVAFTFLLSLDWKKIKIKYLIIILLALVCVVCLVAFSNIEVFERIRSVFKDPSAGARFSSWEKGFEVIKNTYFMGIGYNLYPAYNLLVYNFENGMTGAGTDSSIQLMAITSGLLGVILMFMFFKNIWKKIPVEMKSLLIASLVICNFNNLLFYSLWVFPFYIVAFSLEKPDKKLLNVAEIQRQV